MPLVNSWLRSSCKHSWSEGATILLDNLASSANKNKIENFITDGKPLMYKRKSSGPRMPPLKGLEVSQIWYNSDTLEPIIQITVKPL